MNKKEFKDFRTITRILEKHSKNKIDIPPLEDMEEKILSQLEIRKLKKEIKVLKRLEYGLILGIFLVFVFFFPWQIREKINRYSTSPEKETLFSLDIDEMVREVENSFKSYLEVESGLDPLMDEDIFASWEN